VKAPSNCPGGASNCISGTKGCANVAEEPEEIHELEVEVEVAEEPEEIHELERLEE